MEDFLFKEQFGYVDQLSQARIRSSLVEGQQYIKKITPIKINKQKQNLYIIASFFTLGLVYILTVYDQKWAAYFCYDFCQIEGYLKNLKIDGATHLIVLNSENIQSIVQIIRRYNKQFMNKEMYFQYKFMRYDYIVKNSWFKCQEFIDEEMTGHEIYQRYSNGLYEQSRIEYLKDKYGQNKIQVHFPNVVEYFVNEYLDPKMQLVYLGCIVWFIQNLFIYVSALILVTILFNYWKYNSLIQLLQNIKFQTEKEQEQLVKVFRQNNYQDFEVIKSLDIVPGDLICVEPKIAIPADCILISGECIVNEGHLTGQNQLVQKFVLADDQKFFNFYENNSNQLFDGSIVESTKQIGECYYTIALVLRTGFYSQKGQQMRNVIFPIKDVNQFFIAYIQIVKFFFKIGLIFMIYQLITLYFNQISSFEIFTTVLNFILYLIPPQIFIVIQIPLFFSVIRLKRFSITCFKNDDLINAGSLDTFFFDKTGTITEDTIKIIGIFHENFIQDKQIINKINNGIVIKLLASCNSLQICDDKDIVGNTFEKQMLFYSDMKIAQYNILNVYQTFYNDDYQINVLKQFQFESSLGRGSVIVEDVYEKRFYSFFIGVTDELLQICYGQNVDQIQKLKKISDQISLSGLRVICMAYKQMYFQDIKDAQNLDREDIEENIEFLGFLILTNKVQEGIDQQIKLMKENNIDIKILSGDNVHTCIEIAKQVGIMRRDIGTIILDSESYMTNHHSIIIKYLQKDINIINDLDEQIQDSILQCRQVQFVKNKINKKVYEIQKARYIKNKQLQYLQNLIQNQLSEIAITGNFFNNFLNNKFNNYDIDFSEVINYAKVFGRHKPEYKRMLIEIFQKKGKKVGMCGGNLFKFIQIYQIIWIFSIPHSYLTNLI